MKILTHLLLIFILSSTMHAQSAFTNFISPVSYNKYTNPAIDNNGHIWIACSSNSSLLNDVIEYDGANWILHTSPFASISGNINTAIEIDNNNRVWLGSTNGAACFNGASWTAYTSANGTLQNNVVNAIAFEGQTIWIGTNGGLSKYDGSTWNTFTKINSGLPADTVYSIFVSGGNDIWLGQRFKLTQFNGTSFSVYSAPTNQITSIVKTGQDFYLSVSKGILKFNGINYDTLFKSAPEILDLPIAVTGISRLHEGSGKILFCREQNNAVYQYDPADTSYTAWYYKKYMLTSPSSQYLSARFNEHNNKIIISARFVSTGTAGFMELDPIMYGCDFGLGPSQGADLDNYKHLDVNEVSAAISNRADRYWDFNNSRGRYEVPKGSGKSALFASALWLGGFDSIGSLHVAAQTYRIKGSDYWPGPLDTINATCDTITSCAYDKVWKIDSRMITDFQKNFFNGKVQDGTWPVPQDILDWPAHGSGAFAKNLAPFVDMNGDGIYRPLQDGDYPKIKGDQCIYTIYNDNLAAHGESEGLSFGVEVHQMSYAFYCDQLHESDKILNYTTFNEYTFINRSKMKYDSVYACMFSDADIGNYLDDAVSSNPPENFAMAFNRSSFDYNGNGNGYENHPPILSMVTLEGPPAYPNDGMDNNNNAVTDESDEHCLLTNFMVYRPFGQFPNVYPDIPEHYYNYSKSIYKDSTHLIDLGHSGSNINFYWPHPPDTTMMYGDVVTMRSSGPFRLGAGEMIRITEALVCSWDTSKPYSIKDTALFAQNLRNVRKVRDWHRLNNFPSCFATSQNEDNGAPDFTIFPNPSSGAVTLSFSGQTNGLIEVFDMRGRCCFRTEKNNQFTFINLELNHLSTGLYAIRITWTDGKVTTKKVAISKY